MKKAIELFDKQLTEFMSSPYMNKWLSSKYYDVYVRKAYHMVDGELTQTMDLASVVVSSRYRRMGTFKGILERMQSIGLPVYIENVHSTELVMYLTRLMHESPDNWKIQGECFVWRAYVKPS